MKKSTGGRLTPALSGMNLYTPQGRRKYINADERERFLRGAHETVDYVRTFCLTLLYTGCRVSEALALTAADIQPASGVISFRTLKRREKLVVREVPVPPVLIAALERVHGISKLQRDPSKTNTRLWPRGRTWAWMRVKEIMAVAEIVGPQASPKGLRHGFGAHAIQHNVPLPLLQRWYGHARMETTAVYTTLVGPDEVAIASRMW